MSGHRVRFACALAAAVVADPGYAALGTDNLQLRVGGGLRYDSNVFRTPDGVQTRLADGTTGRSDMIATTNVGATVILPVSRQQFIVNADFNMARYDKFSALDFNGQDLRALWRWEAGSWLSGDLGVARSKALANFATTIGSNRNVRTTDQQFFTLNYPFHTNWRANVGATESTTRHSDPTNRQSDNDTSSRSVGIQYFTGAQNYIGLQGTTLETRYNNLFTVGGRPFNNSYDQNSVAAVAGYSPTSLTRVQGTLGRTRREPQQAGQPEITGTTGSVLMNWRPTAATALNVDYTRDFGPAIDVITASSRANTLTIAPTWIVTEKVTLVGTLRRQERDYSDNTGIVQGGSARHDRIDAYGLVAVWRPLQRTVVNLSAQREQRHSNTPGQDYTANVLSATVQFAF